MPTVRPAVADDRSALYRICLRTGDAGRDATSLYDDGDLLGEVYVGAHLALPDTIAFVAEDDRGVAGYVLAALDTAGFERACEESWWPRLRAAHPLPTGDDDADGDPGASPRHPGGRDARLIEHIHHPPTTPDWIVATWQAHVHVDLLPWLQGSGMGRGLMETMLASLRDHGVTGVHLGVATDNERAIGFYRHLGFVRLAADHETTTMGMRLANNPLALR